MNRLFVHQPLFRVITPIFSGIVIYLLILLINNNVGALEEQFLGQELYVCIGLSYLIQEFSRYSLVFFSKLKYPISELLRVILQIVISIIFSILIVTGAIRAYYQLMLDFEPVFSELLIFNSIFSMITLIYISLYISHDFLQRINHRKLEYELELKEDVEADFQQFKRGINPQLLFESLESLIILMKVDKEKADDFLDHLSGVYRYVLSRKNELVEIQTELDALSSMIELFDSLPNRNLSMEIKVKGDFMMVPGVLLQLVENVIRNSIATPLVPLKLKLEEDDQFLRLSYENMDKIGMVSIHATVKEISRSYGLYSDQWFDVEEVESSKTIKVPKLLVIDL